MAQLSNCLSGQGGRDAILPLSSFTEHRPLRYEPKD